MDKALESRKAKLRSLVGAPETADVNVVSSCKSNMVIEVVEGLALFGKWKVFFNGRVERLA